MINNVVIMGRLTKDPELKTTQSGLSVVSFTVAVDRNCQKDGERRADFLNVVAMEADSRVCGEILRERLHDCHSGINSNAKI